MLAVLIRVQACIAYQDFTTDKLNGKLLCLGVRRSALLASFGEIHLKDINNKEALIQKIS